ncbi:MAG: alpha/beta fold hydrolase [Gammaproteobacteria bacterium]|nr:alpha/beta fold hydrolase [Gammaproteobacteria bacterium]
MTTDYKAGIFALAALMYCVGVSGARADSFAVTHLPGQSSWAPPSQQAPIHENYLDTGDAKLWYWDTGGDGEAVILLHPMTGSAAIWGYQQPALAAAGYRVIAYSRRGHFRSEAGQPEPSRSQVDDLHALVDHLGLSRFHLVGSAGGGFIVPDYAAAHPDRLLSITIACSTAGIADREFRDWYEVVRPESIAALPHWVKELGPSYRAAYPEGVAAWRELEEHAMHTMTRMPPSRHLGWDVYGAIDLPVLLLGGDADIFMPPPMLRELARHMRDPSVVIIREAGHSAYWEQPAAFNRALLDFLQQHPAR